MRTEPWIVGVTGPTGAGKSVLTGWLRERGVPVVDTDRIAREIVEPGTPALAALVKAFSPAVLCPNGSLNRRELAARAFATPEGRATLNAITHPPVLARTKEERDAALRGGARLVALDVPLLFESGADALCNRTVAVLASPDRRLARILARDGLTPAQARARMNAQPTEQYYVERADEVLRNDGDLEAFCEVCRAWLERLLEA